MFLLTHSFITALVFGEKQFIFPRNPTAMIYIQSETVGEAFEVRRDRSHSVTESGLSE